MTGIYADQTGNDKDVEVASERIVMDWMSPIDPENPRNWGFVKKAYHTSIAAMYAFIVTFASSIYASGYLQISQEFSVSSTVSLLGVSLYCLGLAFGPVLAAPLSETFGRLLVYRISLPLSILFIIGAATSKNMSTLAVCRFFAAFSGSPALSVGGGTMTDIWSPSFRGPATAVWVLAANLGPGVGPIIGGFVAENKGWRWLEWVVVFFSVATYVWSLLMSETYKKIILQRRSKCPGLADIPQNEMPSFASVRAWIHATMFRPVVMLVSEPIVSFFSLYVALNFGILYNFFAALPFVFGTIYQFDRGQIGLTFVPICVGCILATITTVLIDRLWYQNSLHSEIKRKNNEGRQEHHASIPPEKRLFAAILGSLGPPISLFWFAWTARANIHWISPVMATMPFAWGNLCLVATTTVYILDCYGPDFGASAMSAGGFARYTFAAAFPLFTLQMYKALSIPWAVSLLGFLTILMVPIPLLLFRYGKKIRGRSMQAIGG